MYKSGKSVKRPTAQELKNYNKLYSKVKPVLKIKLTCEFKNDKQAITLANKFKGLALNPGVEISINFIRI